jgi:hypothetical protein
MVASYDALFNDGNGQTMTSQGIEYVATKAGFEHPREYAETIDASISILDTAGIAIGENLPTNPRATLIRNLPNLENPRYISPTPAIEPITPTADNAPRVVNAETIRAALEGSTLKTTQGSVSIPVVERYVRMLEAQSPAPPIRVAEGGVIVDGNHTYVAGRVYGKEPLQVPGAISPSQLPKVKPIQEIGLSEKDFGNR